jgi:DNA-binding MarR family transcriptional regulator
VSSDEADFRSLLLTLTPSAREHLRNVLIHDQADRDAIASQLLRYRDERSDDWTDNIDMLTMHPERRRRVARLLGELSTER